jgi:hypothetical protein
MFPQTPTSGLNRLLRPIGLTVGSNTKVEVVTTQGPPVFHLRQPVAGTTVLGPIHTLSPTDVVDIGTTDPLKRLGLLQVDPTQSVIPQYITVAHWRANRPDPLKPIDLRPTATSREWVESPVVANWKANHPTR